MAVKAQETDKRASTKKADRPSAELLKRQIRSSLFKARNEAGMTQKQTAQSLDWSLSKVVRIEQGTVSVSPTDVRAMLDIYGVEEEDRVEYLVDLARQARDAPNWDDFGEVMTGTFRELVAQEPSARHIWKHEPTFVPGLLQTERYTRSTLLALGRRGRDLEERAALRAKRQLLLERDVQPELHFVIGEAVLRRKVHTTAISCEQILHLVGLNERPNINLYLLPFAAGIHPLMGTPFTILQFDLPDLDDVLYLEDGFNRTAESDDPFKVRAFLESYNVIQDLAEGLGSFEDQARQILDELYPAE